MESSPPLSDLDPLIEYSEDELLEDEMEDELTLRPNSAQRSQAPLDEPSPPPNTAQQINPPLNEPPLRPNSAQRSQAPLNEPSPRPSPAQQKVLAEQEAYDALARERIEEALEADDQVQPPLGIAEKTKASMKGFSSTANK